MAFPVEMAVEAISDRGEGSGGAGAQASANGSYLSTSLRLLKTLGIHGRCLYSFRHFFGLHMAGAGLPIHKLMKVMGHERITTTQVYLECEAQEFAEEFRQLARQRSRGFQDASISTWF